MRGCELAVVRRLSPYSLHDSVWVTRFRHSGLGFPRNHVLSKVSGFESDFFQNIFYLFILIVEYSK